MSQVTRVTIALPKDLWESVKLTVPAGQRSGLIAAALESELRRRRRLNQLQQLRQFQENMKGKYGILPDSAEDIEQMRLERDHAHDSLP
jgi:metal-responsive CopG/Arc/MetJ family transcriptional regulator